VKPQSTGFFDGGSGRYNQQGLSVSNVVARYGMKALEFGTGKFVGKAHCNPDELLSDRSKLQRPKSNGSREKSSAQDASKER
jgi:hypothetical protein